MVYQTKLAIYEALAWEKLRRLVWPGMTSQERQTARTDTLEYLQDRIDHEDETLAGAELRDLRSRVVANIAVELPESLRWLPCFVRTM